jgi:transposase
MPRTGRPRTPVELQEAERDFLQRLVARRTAPAGEVLHARIILLTSEGLNNKEVAKRLSTGEHTVSYWRRRFARLGVEGLSEMPRSGAPRRISDEQVERVLRTTLEETPPAATHWSTRSLAARLGLSPQAIHRIWRAFGLQPHRQEVFTLSKDPYFIEKVRDVVGLYMNPPQNALVLSVDEKSQIQALERSQPMLPMGPGRPQRWSHDYYRHGTTSLFAALDVATGRIIGATKSRHRSQEFLSFLRQIEREVASPLEVHLILDNYATHKTAEVARWLRSRPRWHLHFLPTHSSWLNQVERFFAQITSRRIRRGCFRSVAHLRQAIEDYLTHHNANPKPFRWTASADTILGKVANLCRTLM